MIVVRQQWPAGARYPGFFTTRDNVKTVEFRVRDMEAQRRNHDAWLEYLLQRKKARELT